MDSAEVMLHGRRVAYRSAGTGGPTLLLVHGITQDSRTWEYLAQRLPGGVRLVAPDLPGHGGSENPAGDHSMGAYASTLRDLMVALEIPRATMIGHSLGGGVSLQFAYQFPEMVERLVLIASGGLGRSLTPVLRAAALPGSEIVISALASDPVRRAGESFARALRRAGLRPGSGTGEVWRGLQGLATRDARKAFLGTVRTNIGLGGQAVSAKDRLYLAAHLPTLIVWGDRDRIIPLGHAKAAHQAIRGSYLHVVAGAGHFPHVDRPRSVAQAIEQFMSATPPAALTPERWGEILRDGPPAVDVVTDADMEDIA